MHLSEFEEKEMKKVSPGAEVQVALPDEWLQVLNMNLREAMQMQRWGASDWSGSTQWQAQDLKHVKS